MTLTNILPANNMGDDGLLETLKHVIDAATAVESEVVVVVVASSGLLQLS